MLILGIDPGYARTGWGLVKKTGGNVALVKYGCIETKAGTPNNKRLASIFDHLTKLIKSHKPQAVAVENLFFNTNAKTAMKVGEARGVILIAIEKQKVPVFHYTPLQVKTTTTTYGRADKTQVQKMVQAILKLETIPKPDDAADALAVAITHCFTVK